jgi:hypothetical protein
MLGMVIALVTISAATVSTVVLRSTTLPSCDDVCIQEYIDNCDFFQFHRQGEFGGTTVRLMGFEEGNCSIEIHTFAEISKWKYTCSVPMDKLREWRNWDANGGIDSSHISSYCIEA